MRFTLLDIAILLSFLWVLLVLTPGCVSISYTQENGKENLEVKTLFKSLDGLWAERDKETGFSIIIDKTYTHDPMRAVAELMETYQELQSMGIRYDPDWRSPMIQDHD